MPKVLIFCCSVVNKIALISFRAETSVDEIRKFFFGHSTPFHFLPVVSDYQIVRNTSLLVGIQV